MLRLLHELGRVALRVGSAGRAAFAEPGETPGPPSGPDQRRRADGTVILDAGLAAILGVIVVLAIAAAGAVYIYVTGAAEWSS